MMAVVFTVDAESTTGQPRVPNEEIAEVATRERRRPDPVREHRPAQGAARRRRGAPPDRRPRRARLQVPPQRAGVLPERPPGVPALRGDRGGRAAGAVPHRPFGRRLGPARGRRHPAQVLQSDPRRRRRGGLPRLKIVLAHPSFPWQDEAISIAMHKPQVSIDLSGWSPKYFPPQLVHYANTLLRNQVLFGTRLPLHHARPLARGLRHSRHQARGAAVDPEGERHAPARAGLSR